MTTIRLATEGDIKFLLHLQAKFSNQVGYLPRPALEKYIGQSSVKIAIENGLHAGYMLTANTLSDDFRTRPILQAAVPLDLQRRSIGTLLLNATAKTANFHRRSILQAWVREDLLETIAFWTANKFTPICTRHAGKRGGVQILFRRLVCLDATANLREVKSIPPAGGGHGRDPHQLNLFPPLRSPHPLDGQ